MNHSLTRARVSLENENVRKLWLFWKIDTIVSTVVFS